jgi:hypothetical protein
VGNDTIDVGKKSFIQQQMGDQSSNPGAYAAMSQQSSDSGRGTQSVPQKLVQLVGHRDPKSCREWVRPPLPAQR